MGRPSTFNQEIVDLICERIADGESLRSICRDESMPSTSSIFKWLNEHESFSNQYARAREAQADTMADEILDIADEKAFDSIEGENGSLKANQEWIARSRLRVDARKWLASKMAPKKYGEKLQSEVTGADGAPLAIQIVRFGEKDADDSAA